MQKRVQIVMVVFTFLIFLSGCGGDESENSENDRDDTTSEVNDEDSGSDEQQELCGNKVIDPGEECDSYLKKCTDVDSSLYTGGNALCNENCTLDLSQCVEVEENPDYNTEQPDNEIPDDGDTADVTSGFSNNPDGQCSVDRNDVCTKADYDAWSGSPTPAPQNSNVLRLCIGGVWVWAPFAYSSTQAECTADKCLPGEARQFLQAGSNGFCICLNKCTLQGEDAENQTCGQGRNCIAVNDVNGEQVHICGGHE